MGWPRVSAWAVARACPIYWRINRGDLLKESTHTPAAGGGSLCTFGGGRLLLLLLLPPLLVLVLLLRLLLLPPLQWRRWPASCSVRAKLLPQPWWTKEDVRGTKMSG